MSSNIEMKKADKPLVSVIIVNYNGRDNVLACLESFREQSYQPLEIIVIDNGSTDDSIACIRKRLPQVKVIENGKNLGFGAAINIGASQSSGKYLMLYNDDILVKEKTVSVLVDVMENDPNIGAAQSKLLSFINPKIVQSARSYLTWTGITTGEGGFVDNKDTQTTSSFSAGAPIVRKDIFKKLSGFDKNYFLYFEETDLAWRIWLAGYKVVYVPTSEVLHKGGSTTKKLASDFVVYHAFRNRLNSLIKNLELKSLIIILPTHVTLLIGGSFLFLLVGKPKQAIAIWRAIGSNLAHLFSTLSEREKVQQVRKISDKELLPTIMGKISFAYFLNLTKRYLKDVYLYEGR